MTKVIESVCCVLQVAIAVCVAMSLPVHAVVCVLILGCCPTGMLSPLMAVLHQSHVELAVILSLLTTTTAFGKADVLGPSCTFIFFFCTYSLCRTVPRKKGTPHEIRYFACFHLLTDVVSKFYSWL